MGVTAVMKLLNDATSPFGRKVLVAAIERAVPLEEQFVNIGLPGPIDELNPLRQIPTLVTDGGQTHYDSDVILQYIDSRHAGPRLCPAGDWAVMTRMSLANGLIEAVLLRIMELRRPAGEQSPSFVKKLEDRVWRVLPRLDAIIDQLTGEPLRADQIAIACALEYTDFRYTPDWRSRCPALAKWLEPLSQRPSMAGSRPTRSAPWPSAPAGPAE
jgi:glutathione S-transferase